MRQISKTVKDYLLKEKRMESCELCGSKQVQWAHIFQYAGKQINEVWNILALCPNCHAQATPHNNEYKSEVRDRTEWIAVQRMTTADLHKYNKKDWHTLVWYLSKKANEYGW